ncbi:glycosyltransferase 87 family protein [Corynebacterium sp. H113]|uniref:glycosyltransferase 87 family protein n=1 Tax=Corynebacterium sp. H113 TaxID=3133419 RepID=UPI0030A07FF9
MLYRRIASLSARWKYPLWILAALISIGMIGYRLHEAYSGFNLDLHVFRDAGIAFKNNAPLYGPEFRTFTSFPFIYPPFAALLFYPLAFTSGPPMQLMWAGATLLSIFLILVMVAKRLQMTRPWLVAFLLMGVAMAIDPLRRDFIYGQIDVFLALFVVADVLGFLPKKLRGLGIGIAAGIKITPAAFALLFLVRGQWGNVVKSAAWFFVTALLGHLLRPKDSVYFWTKQVLDEDRAGRPTFESNQAMSGVLSRFGLSGEPLELTIKVLFVFGVITAIYLAWKFTRDGNHVTALFMVGMAAMIFGPYSVGNHWAIITAGVPLLLVAELRPFLAGLAVWLAHAIAPYRIFPADGYQDVPIHIAAWGSLQGEVSFLFYMLVLFTALNDKLPSESTLRPLEAPADSTSVEPLRPAPDASSQPQHQTLPQATRG